MRDESWIGQLQAAVERAGVDPAGELVGLFDALLIGGAMTRGRLAQDRSVVQDAKEAARGGNSVK
ncbi:hypothetical protein [Micromonospora sp. NPDC005173]|uniref:hypothetical protein n=1 Tax=Micromonospora sp. NPDC005173 TaxID=3157165 RepID=UPI0033A90A63